jgi:hypothetical protein
MEHGVADNQVVKTRTMTMLMRDDGIIHGIAFPDSQQSVEDARENVECARMLSGGRRVPLLLDIRDTGTLTREARMYFSGEEGADPAIAVALVADSAFTRVVGNLFIRLAKMNYPVQLFASTDEAINWLRDFR